MRLIHRSSLAATIDAVNEAAFFGTMPPEAERREAARWIASRRGLPHSYAGMFAPTEKDFAGGIRLFTGERIRTGAATGHILGEEACRALILLASGGAAVRDALARATANMAARLRENTSRAPGMYCCGSCSVALWRHLAAGGLDCPERRLAAGLRTLKSYRNGKGRWRVFPYYYTLLALAEIDLPAAVGEMRYAAGGCERVLKRRAPAGDRYDRRRRALAEKVLARC